MARQRAAAGGRSTSERRGTPGGDKAGKQASQGQKPRQGKSQPARSQGKQADKAPAPRPTAKQAPARKSKPSATGRARVRPTIQKRPSVFRQARQIAGKVVARATDRAFWQDLRQKLPPRVDELGALLLIVLGVVTLNALLNTSSEAPLAIALARALRQLSGNAAYMIALGLVAAGIVVLMSKFSRTISVGWGAILAFELGFAALAALLHVLANDPEPRVLASEGKGGGYLGWLLTELLSLTGMGRALMELLLITALVVSVIFLLQLRVQHVLLAAQRVRALLERGLKRLDDPDGRADNPGNPRANEVESLGRAPADISGAEEGASLPSRRNAARPTNTERQEIAAQARGKLGAANGRSLVSLGEPGGRESVVPRELPPSNGVRGRIRRASPDPEGGRTFTVDDFREVKKVGKRDANLPPLDLLSDLELNIPTAEEINTNVRIIRHTLLEFDVETEVIDVKVGPTVTQYAVSPLTEQLTEDGERVVNRVRVSEITNLNGDLALALSARRLRIQAPVPGESYVGVEVPNRQPSTVALRPVLESEVFYRVRHHPLALPLGRDTSGAAFVADLGTMPHLLIAGTTGSGKSIMLAAMTTALVMNSTPEQVRLVLLDPKMVELSRFNGLPHLLGPVETELDRIIGVLRWATREMDRRYRLLEQEAARNIHVYNAGLGRKRASEALPYIVIIIDEIGDLMMQRPDETERALTRLAQMARAVGMHLMVATQRPSVDVITGLIKANFPARISFAVASSIDSRVILDTSGAEMLMGRGDMLFLAPDAAGPQRIQGCYVSDEEVSAVVEHWRGWHEQQIAAGALEPITIGPWERGMTRREVLAETDPMLEEAIALVVEAGEASASLIQRRLGLGYPRAARIVDLLYELGIVGEQKPGGRSRDVLVKPGTDPFEGLVDKRLKDRE